MKTQTIIASQSSCHDFGWYHEQDRAAICLSVDCLLGGVNNLNSMHPIFSKHNNNNNNNNNNLIIKALRVIGGSFGHCVLAIGVSAMGSRLYLSRSLLILNID
jgi:hypothetical protein